MGEILSVRRTSAAANALLAPSPLAVGGLGGSGTRVVAAILARLGYSLGPDLNRQLDNLWFTFLFKRLKSLEMDAESFAELVALFVKRMSTANELTKPERQLVRRMAIEGHGEYGLLWRLVRAWKLTRNQGQLPAAPWGWKEPNTQVVLGRLVEALPEMSYISVVRNGLDMAHSRNQNQVKFWHEAPAGEPTPSQSLKFWRRSTEYALAIGATMAERFFFLNFDRLCQDAESELERLSSFLGVRPSEKDRSCLRRLVHVPLTTGRFKRQGVQIFDPDDVEFVRSLGFDCDVAGR